MGTEIFQDFPATFKSLTEAEQLAEREKADRLREKEEMLGRKSALINREPPEYFKLLYHLAHGKPNEIEELYNTNHRLIFLSYEHSINLQAEMEKNQRIKK